MQDTGLKPEGLKIWCADEARIGQKNKITRRLARRGTRPVAPQDQRYASTYIFGAACPQQGKGAALVLPYCNTERWACTWPRLPPSSSTCPEESSKPAARVTRKSLSGFHSDAPAQAS